MMAAILNSAILDSAILHKTLTQTNSIWLKLIHSHSTWWCQPSWILPSWFQPIWNKKEIHSFILTQLDDGSNLEFYHLGFSHFAQKNFTHSFWLNLMMAAILNSAMLDSATVILDSDTLLSSLRFTQKHSHSTLTLTQTNSIWLKLIHSYLTWWWQPSWILPSWIRPFCTKLWLKLIQSDSNSFILTQLNLMMIQPSWILPFGFNHFVQKNFTHSFWLNLMMAAILNSAMLDSDTAILDSDTLLSSLRFTQKHSHSTLTLTQTNSIWLKLIHSHLTWWWQPSWILPSWISAILDSAILVFPLKLTQLAEDLFPPFAQKKTSLIHSDSTWWCAAILNSAMLNSATAILDSDTLLSSLRFTQKHSHSTLTLTETNSI